MYRKKVHIHFVGIGGIGMSGIASILRHQGYSISGCDKDTNQKSIQQLKHLGCTIYQGNNTTGCQDSTIDIVVYSSAIQENNPEIIKAQERNVPTIRRALMLAELMRTKYSIAIAGSHGKTTTTSLVSHIFIEAGLDPTVIIGGHLINISTNARLGSGDFLIAEADESDRSILHLQATLAVLTNIDLEHLETYTDLTDVKETYIRFLNNLPFYGKAFVCIDDSHIQSILPLPHLKLIKYGLHSEAEITAKQIKLYPAYSTFNVFHLDRKLGSVKILMPGKHNILNCLGAISVALDVGIPFSTIAQAIANFKGIERRFWFRGLYKGAEIFDDYGHHPNEVKQTLLVAKKRAKKKLTVIFQPHRYTRTYHLWQQFIETFLHNPIDHLIITDIYPASEKPIDGVTAERLVKELQHNKPPFDVSYVPYDQDFKQLQTALDGTVAPDDLILLLGAGKLTHFAHILIQ